MLFCKTLFLIFDIKSLFYIDSYIVCKGFLSPYFMETPPASNFVQPPPTTPLLFLWPCFFCRMCHHIACNVLFFLMIQDVTLRGIGKIVTRTFNSQRPNILTYLGSVGWSEPLQRVQGQNPAMLKKSSYLKALKIRQ